MFSELKPTDQVLITQGRYTNRIGVYLRAMPCGQFHAIDLGKGLVTLAPRNWIRVIQDEQTETVKNANTSTSI